MGRHSKYNPDKCAEAICKMLYRRDIIGDFSLLSAVKSVIAEELTAVQTPKPAKKAPVLS